jgi:rare lipoprotein A
VAKPVYRSGTTQGRTAQATAQPPEVASPAPAAHPVDLAKISSEKAYQVGVASYYGKKFHGRKTANGEVFNMYKLTAAHRVLPLGTYIKVTNLGNGRWVEVKVNDRGPFVEGRVLDLSFAAALELEMVRQGTAKVMIEITKAVE